jgi:hypothetical protein
VWEARTSWGTWGQQGPVNNTLCVMGGRVLRAPHTVEVGAQGMGEPICGAGDGA